jgi:DNA-directed RNA polymerase subunit RPC12/RpoP
MWEFFDFAELEAVFPGSVLGTFTLECGNCGGQLEIETGDGLLIERQITCPHCQMQIIFTNSDYLE